MNAFDKIIGYESIKQELVQIADTLKNHEVYGALGAGLAEIGPNDSYPEADANPHTPS